ncbi:hypothetical protein RhiirA4_483313 [Rhizophagus irregularis]|uniref:Uncharacterized protein n=1 Tax=Rhizophagus irregularis TaxID=588596 RepID=A0A2I1HMD9_9GLOM|nr:hypothetical protein RhiirA4_483313 [Rhizophagus irregularis]
MVSQRANFNYTRALQYISKYASKAELCLAAFSDILIQILSEIKNRWTKCQQENIVHIFPWPSPIHEGPQWEEFCHVKVVLHIHHQNFQQLTENSTISWLTLYSHHLEKINADPIVILGLSIYDAKSKIIDEEEEDLMGPSSSFDCSSDLESQDMDRNHDWINDSRQWYSDVDLVNADIFRISRINDEEENIIASQESTLKI